MQDWWQKTFAKGRQYLTVTDASGYPVQVAYGEKGVGKPLILLHGIGSWSYNWRNSIEPLSKHCRVICFDAKGFGFSEKPQSRREVEGHQVIEFERIIRELCHEPVTIVAESLGALIALALAQERPEIVGRLVVVNVPIFAERLPHWGMRLFSHTPLEIIQIIDSLRLTYLFAPLIREVMAIERREVLFDPSILTPEDIYWITYPFIEFPGTLTKAAEELKIADREIENCQVHKTGLLSQIQSKLNSINCPTQILWGEHDSWFPLAHGYKLHQCLSNSQLKVLPNCRHDASSGASEVVNEAIIEFLRTTHFL